MSKVVFDGENRLISLNLGVETLDVQIDLYSEWKRWAILDNNLKYLQAFRTFGGDQTIQGQFAPRYFFLTNGWRIVVSGGEDLLVGTNLYTDELDSPFIISNDSTVSLNNSDAAVVDNGIAQNLDYNGIVTLNSIIGISSTSYPAGTLAQPVNNLADAKIIAQQYGISTIHIYGHVHFNVDLEGFVVIGGNINDIVHFHNDVSVDKTTFKQCLLTGHYTGNIAADNCIIENDLYGMGGYFQYCGFKGHMHFDPNVETVFNDCHSQVPGTNSPSFYLNQGVQLSLRKYSGGLAIYDSQTGTTATLEFLVGNCRVLSGNTGGELVIRGLATLTDESDGTIINTSGLLVPYNVATQHSLNVNTELLINK
jgi:hypothetical protein